MLRIRVICCLAAVFVFFQLTVLAQTISVDDHAAILGEINNIEVVEKAIIIRNTGNKPLTIGRIQSTCSCVVAMPSTNRLQPGEQTTFLLRFDPAGLRGRVHRTLRVLSNDPETPKRLVTVRATVRETWRHLPKRLHVVAGGEVELTVENLGLAPFTHVTLQAENGVVSPSTSQILPAGGELTFKFTASETFTSTNATISYQLGETTRTHQVPIQQLEADGSAGRSGEEPNWRPGEVLIKFKNDRVNLSMMDKAAFSGIASAKDCKGGEMVRAGSNLACMLLQDGESVESALTRFAADPDVAYVQPNFVYEPRQIIPDDSNFVEQWALQNTGQNVAGVIGTAGADMQATDAWSMTTGPGTIAGNGAIIAVLDNGVDYDHPDLAGQMWDGSNCVDHEGNPIPGGCIHGYDYSGSGDNDPDTPGGDHGTHVAGIAAAIGNNSTGVAGVAWDVKIMAVRSATYSSSEFVKGIYFAGNNGATVINASWGWSSTSCTNIRNEGQINLGGSIGDVALYDAIADFPGILVAAAGNSNRDHNGSNYFDSSDYGHDTICWDGLDNVINVAVTDSNDGKWSSSDFGALIHLAAPGRHIYSTSTNGNYTFKSGSSMAAPQVVGAISLIWGLHPELSAAEVREVILANGDCVSDFAGKLFTSGNGYCPTTGGMRMNVYKALAALATPTVSNLTAYVDDSQGEEILEGCFVNAPQPYWTWTAPGDQGIIDHYNIEIDDGATFTGATNEPFFDASAAGVTLTEGEHVIRIVGVNDQGVEGAPVTHRFSHQANGGPLLTVIGNGTVFTEGESTQLAIFPGSLPAQPVSIDYRLADGSASSDSDYAPSSGTLTWGINDTHTQFVTVQSLADQVDEFNEDIILLFSSPQNITIPCTEFAVVIDDTDAPPDVTVNSPIATDESGLVTFTVSLSHLSSKPVSFDYAFASNTAEINEDFTAGAGTLTIDPGNTFVEVSATIMSDGFDEGAEQLNLELTNISNAARSTLTGIGTIADNDVVISLQAGWNLVSIPVTLSAEDLATLLADGPAWTWDAVGRRFNAVTTLQTKVGYWIFRNNDVILTFVGGPDVQGQLSLTRGWHLIGALNNVALPVGAGLSGRYLGLNNGALETVPSLQRKGGYWTFVLDDATVELFQ